MSETLIQEISVLLFNREMTIDEIRRKNLALLAEECLGIGRFAERIGKDPSQVSQWLNASPDSRTGKPRGMRSSTCREIEAKLGKPENWLDRDHGGDADPHEIWPFARITAADWSRLGAVAKADIEDYVEMKLAKADPVHDDENKHAA